jgi:hypothetical protein
MHCRALAAPRSPRIRERGLPAESGACPQSGHIGPPVGPFSGSPAGLPRPLREVRTGGVRCRGLRTAPRYRESAPARGVRGAIRLLVLLRLLLAVFGLGRLLRIAGFGLRVRLAGLRILLAGLVGLVLRGFAHAARLPGTDANSPVGTCDGAAATLLLRGSRRSGDGSSRQVAQWTISGSAASSEPNVAALLHRGRSSAASTVQRRSLQARGGVRKSPLRSGRLPGPADGSRR